MRLSKLKLSGFKSFIDPTTIEFDKQIVGVLGPNGCGKSNVIDAVRWVMGESSAKNLRGGQMSDVIFNGSSSRKPASLASVELIFDNSEGKLGGEYRSYTEIAIKREVTREGISTYSLNNTRCRKRDIGDVFLGTGLGPRGYTIIEQGMISKLIEAKPDDLRGFVEEAAGISVYKKRRHDTELRIKHTVENLDRLEDIRQEQTKQLSKLEKQAESAKKYNNLKEELLNLDIQHIALQSSSLNDESESCSVKLRAISLELEERLTGKISIESEVEKLRIFEQDKRDVYEEIHEKYYNVGKQIATKEQSLTYAKEKKKHLQQELVNVENNIIEYKTDINIEQSTNSELCEKLIEVEPMVIELQDNLEHSKEALVEADNRMEVWSEGWDSLLDSLQKEQRNADIKKMKIEQQDRDASITQGNLERASHEISTIDIEELEIEYEGYKDQSTDIDLRIEQTAAKIETITVEVDNKRLNLSTLNKEIDSDSLELQSSVGQHSSLIELQNSALNKNDENVEEFLHKNHLDACSRLGDKIEVQSGWENATESVLRWYLDALCVTKDINVNLSELLTLDSSVTLLQYSDSPHSPHSPHSTVALSSLNRCEPLLDKVTSEVDLTYMLGTIYACDDFEFALSIRDQLRPEQSIVLQNGMWLGRNWLRSPISSSTDGAEQGILGRKRRIDSLELVISELKEIIYIAKDDKSEKESEIKDSERELSALQNERNEANKSAQQIKSSYAGLSVKLEQQKSRIVTLKDEIRRCDEKKDILSDDSTELRQELEQHLLALEELNETKESLSAEKQQLQQMLTEVKSRVSDLHSEYSQMAIEKEKVSVNIKASDSSLANYRKQFEASIEKEKNFKLQLENGDDPVLELQEELESRLNEQLSIEEDLTAAKKGLEDIVCLLNELESKRQEIDGEINQYRDLVENQKIQWHKIKVRLQTLDERVDKYDLDLDEIIKNLPEDLNEEQLESRIEVITKQIETLGAINLAAVEEYDHELERKTYLDRQLEDLHEALSALEGAISKIDKETKSKFRETFEAINANFQELFPKLFGGGRANLMLIGDDLLDAGVTVMAQPPGKRNSSINLLSGGEKALTAVSLVFAIFKLNPAPFCMLDEVDAPLDDTNVARFCTLVKEMSEKVQFIVITHNKVTMELTDQLCGVTMKEPGVSRVVSVDMEEALEIAEA